MADDLLDAEDLAYLRATQAEARPTPAELRRKVTARTPTGGTTTTLGDGIPVDVRIDSAPDQVPAPMAARLGPATPYKVTLDTGVDVRDGDRIDVSPTEQYETVSDGDPDRWATAQTVWARRVTYPPRATT